MIDARSLDCDHITRPAVSFGMEFFCGIISGNRFNFDALNRYLITGADDVQFTGQFTAAFFDADYFGVSFLNSRYIRG